MSSVIQDLLDGVIGDGARSAKFDCEINFGNTWLFHDNEQDIFAMVKTSQFPGKTHETIDLKFKGRTIPVKGQTKYDNTWSCTFYMTEDHRLKKAFEDWIEAIDQQHNIKQVSENVYQAQLGIFEDGYTTDLIINQKDFHGENTITRYILKYAFPKSVSAVDVDYSSVGTITEFTVEFAYAYFNVDNVDLNGAVTPDPVVLNDWDNKVNEKNKNNGFNPAAFSVDNVYSTFISPVSKETVLDDITNGNSNLLTTIKNFIA